MHDVPAMRIAVRNEQPIRADGDWVLYWMVASRRTRHSFPLQRAVHWARELDRPLIVLEALRAGYPWASARHHRFIIDGMRDNAAHLEGRPVVYHPYVEPRAGAGAGLLEALAGRACVVVTDDYPCFFIPRMQAAAAARLDVRLEAVDGNGLLPLRATDKVFKRAFDFRRFLRKTLVPHLGAAPAADPIGRKELRRLPGIPPEIAKRWPAAPSALLDGSDPALLAALPIDQSVGPVATRGGALAGAERLAAFVAQDLDRYGDDRNHPDTDVASRLSPYLHYGHVGAHQALAAVAEREGWSPDMADTGSRKGKPGGERGWWGMGEAACAFLEELVTWREIGFNMCHLREDYDAFESLPGWALETLAEHAGDEREHVYTLEQLASARTHDEIWNAAQRQLRRDGRIHNYLRMLWGKLILQWTGSPRQAFEVMVELNNRYALDGRDPNSYSGIFWVLGRYDRAWGPERPIFGKVRYMTSRSTRSKLKLKRYLEEYGAQARMSW
jgi:deoxyribodipyrimidine photo-lyase